MCLFFFLAFGPEGLGLILVENIPDIGAIRENIFQGGFELGRLPKETLSKFENEESKWNVGWSHGREYLSKDTPDTMKGNTLNPK